MEKYWQAFHRQQWERADNCVVLIERLPDDLYRLTTKAGMIVYMNLEWGLKHYPVVLCGQPTRESNE